MGLFNLSLNPNIDFNFILSNLDKRWNCYNISKNPSITLDIIIKYHDKPWDYVGLSSNPNVTFDFIFLNQDKPWNWQIHFKKLKKIRNHVKSFKLKNWYKLFLLTKTEEFAKWYYDPENIGGKRIKKN